MSLAKHEVDPAARDFKVLVADDSPIYRKLVEHALITFKLRGDKRPVFRQFLVDEFHSSVVFKCFDPLLVWHVRGLYLRCPYAFSKRPRL